MISYYRLLQHPFVFSSERHTASFCDDISTDGQLINIIFNATTFGLKYNMNERRQSFTDCVCKIRSSSTFRISSLDIRLIDTYKECIPNARVAGISRSDITCSSEMSKLDPAEDGLQEKALTLSFDVVPEFVWIIVQPGLGLYNLF